MWLVPHTLVGVTIASKIPNPLIAIPLAVLSHFLLDATPHWTTTISTRGRDFYIFLTDFGLGFVLGLIFAFRAEAFSPEFWLVISCAAAANLPDAIRFPHYFYGYNSKLFWLTERFHRWVDQDVRHNTPFFGMMGFGILTQVLVVAFCLWLLA